ncbi:odorant receptor 4-like isoform X2 [Cylas formicarius]|uniref:odorant receptor 4-like isoform X2 n=1 Tax=Cylas formicarius TaxID=197179 RepID=UPI0029587F02|nr:odorant receptor 4-like isoform X2 [Cylas formicarius]
MHDDRDNLSEEDGTESVTSIVENVIALICIIGMIYMVVCFARNRKNIHLLLVKINSFKKYGSFGEVLEVDEKANLFSKLFIFYGILGNFVYMLMPQLSIQKCQAKRNMQMINDDVPCGLVVRSRFPFKFDYSPMFEIVFVHPIYTCTVVTIVVLVLTMLLCGFLMHVIHQLGHLKKYIAALKDEHPQEKIYAKLAKCIKYHIQIIEYSQELANSFSSMLLFYITLTSIVLSVLCFEIIMVEAFEDSVRFALHLVGWLIILLSVCYYGQQLIDRSQNIADDVYSIKWVNQTVEIQKRIHMIILRSQTPLTLSAAGMGVVSLPAFLKVLSSAYSFFTLLLKFKP